MKTVELVSSRIGTVRRTVEAEWSPDDGLKISVHDLGEGASMNGDEYECWYTVTSTDLPAFCVEVGLDAADLLASLKTNYSGRRFDTLTEHMEKSALVKFANYF